MGERARARAVRQTSTMNWSHSIAGENAAVNGRRSLYIFLLTDACPYLDGRHAPTASEFSSAGAAASASAASVDIASVSERPYPHGAPKGAPESAPESAHGVGEGVGGAVSNGSISEGVNDGADGAEGDASAAAHAATHRAVR